MQWLLPNLQSEIYNLSSKPEPLLTEPTSQQAKKRFAKGQRLLKHADFERVYKQGRRHFAAHMTVFYWTRPDATNTGAQGLRVGFTVSKALGGAVQRNRARRRLREIVRRRWTRVAAHGYWMVFIASRAALDAPHERLVADVESLLSSAGILAPAGER